MVLALVLAAIAVVAVGWLVMTSAVASGSLTVTSRPAGARILVDGAAQGVTPATVRVPAGDHVLEIHSAGPAQVVSLRIDKGEQVSRFFELPVGTAAASLHVTTSPAGVLVTVDGQPRGKTPVVVRNLNPGPHHVRIRRGSQSLERFIMLESGANGALALPLDPPGGTPTEGHGWLDVSVPVDVKALENGRLVGSTRAGPWQLTAGRHDLEFVNPSIGVYVKTAVDVLAGKTSR